MASILITNACLLPIDEAMSVVEGGWIHIEGGTIRALGADTLLHGRFGDARELVTVRQGGHVTAKPGESRRFSIGATPFWQMDIRHGLARRCALVVILARAGSSHGIPYPVR